jgi:hypothetical protein
MKQVMRASFCIVVALADTLASWQPAAQAQGRPDPVSELIRKGDAREMDNGFCATVTDWPPGTAEGYVDFLRIAVIGYAKVNRFRNNAQCQFDRVTDVFNGPTGRCVRYTWWACATGSNCVRGEDTECLQADGSWRRQ